MGEREAFADPKKKIVFYKSRLQAQLKFGHPTAALIFMHELSHLLLHRNDGLKPWIKGGNDRPKFIPDEESSEWQATMLALSIMAPENDALSIDNATALVEAFGLDFEHAEIRFNLLRRRRRRLIPFAVQVIRAELAGNLKVQLSGNCPVCGTGSLSGVAGRYWCPTCKQSSDKFQDGDSMD